MALDLKTELEKFKPFDDVDETQVNPDEIKDLLDILSEISTRADVSSDPVSE
jgi:hypothetical protein